jgi:hypothetical protein
MTRRFRWGEVCAKPEAKLNWFVKNFVDAYKSYMGRPDAIEHKPEKSDGKLLELVKGIG